MSFLSRVLDGLNRHVFSALFLLILSFEFLSILLLLFKLFEFLELLFQIKILVLVRCLQVMKVCIQQIGRFLVRLLISSLYLGGSLKASGLLGLWILLVLLNLLKISILFKDTLDDLGVWGNRLLERKQTP